MQQAITDETGSSTEAPAPLSMAARQKILIYIGVLVVLLGFGAPNGGLIGLPISFFVKNKLHLTAQEAATFALISHIPVYVAFVFGFARDTWNPLGMRDRGFIVLFGATTAAIYLFFAFVPPTYGSLLLATLLATSAYLFVASALTGMTSMIAQQHVVSGQASAAWNIFNTLPAVVAVLAGGALSDLMEGEEAATAARMLFLAGAAIMTVMAVYGVRRPTSVFDNLHYGRSTSTSPWDDFKRLLKHRPIYPALLVWSLWQFAPGSVTPLQYYLQNTLHAKDIQWGQWNAIFFMSFIPAYLLFGTLCRRFPLRTLLWWGTVVAVPQFIPLLFVHSVNGALMAAVPIGLMGGIANGAYFDLLMRSCPKGLHGTLLMASAAIWAADVRFGDVLGAMLYDRYGGFTVCVIAITVVYALILPVLLLIPKSLIATADGDAPAE